MSVAEIERQAKLLAKDNREAEPEITDIYWFRDDKEVRLVEVLTSVPACDDETLQPFYFRPSPDDGLPDPSAIVLIRPDEVGRIKPPKHWGDWSTAKKLSVEK
jgi:hypothetical protein